ncbi:hypothetical protein LCGC14_2777070, partial [marine sediment metagenome]
MYLSKLMAEIGQTLLYLGILLTWISFIFHWKQKSIEKKNVLLILFSSASFFMWASYAILLKAFIDNDYSYIIVHNFSDNSMTQTERIMAAWANRQGVMILWAALMNTITISVILYLRNEISHPIVFRSITILLFITAIIATFAASPRNPTAFEIDNSVVFNNGIGLPPSLLSFWQQLHPPIAFLAYSSFIFPYAAGLSILSKKTDEIKIIERRPTNHWLNSSQMACLFKEFEKTNNIKNIIIIRLLFYCGKNITFEEFRSTLKALIEANCDFNITNKRGENALFCIIKLLKICSESDSIQRKLMELFFEEKFLDQTRDLMHQ